MSLFSFLSPKTLLSWRTLAIIFAFINLKSLPFSWHIRVFYHFFRHVHLIPYTKRPHRAVESSEHVTHPIFSPTSIHSRSPLLESDFNMHKSNSTYFSDLDLSRLIVTTGVYSPGLGILKRSLEKDGYRGRMGVILGSVFCSFRREIKPYEQYEVQSRVLSWDGKWLYIGSWFLKEGKGKDGKREVLASALSKYVVKKGRFTVAPEKLLRASGYLPERPDGQEVTEEVSEEDGVTETTISGASTVLLDMKASEPLQEPAKSETSWDYERIDKQRLRGLEVVKAFMGLDTQVLEEFECQL